MKRAFITGITGQDGAYLARLLVQEGFQVFGGVRRHTGRDHLWRLRVLGVQNEVRIVPFEITDPSCVERTFRMFKYDHVYNLAAQSFVGLSFEQPRYTMEVNALGAMDVMQCATKYEARVYQASSSEMFGNARYESGQLDENGRMEPVSPYGISKLTAHKYAAALREAGHYVCAGICFNHESPLRGSEFVTQKIVRGLKRWRETTEPLKLGNLDSRRDWGHADDYVRAMYLMMQQNKAGEYVIATGKVHSVRDFVEHAAAHMDIGLRWEGSGASEKAFEVGTDLPVIEVSPEFYRPVEIHYLRGDSSRIRKHGWVPVYDFGDLVESMVFTEGIPTLI